MSVRHIRFQLGAMPPPRLDKALARDVPEEAALSRTRLARLINDGSVAVNGEVVSDPKFKAVEGAEVVVTLEEAVHSFPTRRSSDLTLFPYGRASCRERV